MAKTVRILKAEEAALRLAIQALNEVSLGLDGANHKELRTLMGLVAKLDAPRPEPAPTGLGLPEAERALATGKKYAKWWGNPSRFLKVLNEAGATLDQLEAVARWTNGQGWLHTFSLQTVSNNWGSWLSQAMAVVIKQRPMGTLVGFEEDTDED